MRDRVKIADIVWLVAINQVRREAPFPTDEGRSTVSAHSTWEPTSVFHPSHTHTVIWLCHHVWNTGLNTLEPSHKTPCFIQHLLGLLTSGAAVNQWLWGEHTRNSPHLKRIWLLFIHRNPNQTVFQAKAFVSSYWVDKYRQSVLTTLPAISEI